MQELVVLELAENAGRCLKSRRRSLKLLVVTKSDNMYEFRNLIPPRVPINDLCRRMWRGLFIRGL